MWWDNDSGQLSAPTYGGASALGVTFLAQSPPYVGAYKTSLIGQRETHIPRNTAAQRSPEAPKRSESNPGRRREEALRLLVLPFPHGRLLTSAPTAPTSNSLPPAHTWQGEMG